MKIEDVHSDRVPTPLAHYRQGCRAGDLIFLAGQLASDWSTGVPAELNRRPGYPFYGSDIKDQTRFVLENIKKNLEDAGSDLDHVVKAQVFILDCDLFNGFDEVWQEFFPTPPPRTTVQTGPKGLLVPGTLVEIDVIAVPSTAEVQQVDVPGLGRPIANYTPAVKWNDFVFLAGQLATDFEDGGIARAARVDPNYPFYAAEIEKQTEYTLENLKKALEAAGSDLEHVVKAQVFLKDLNDFSGFDDVWRRYFPADPPPRTTLEMADLLVGDALVEIDLIGVTKETEIEFVNTDAAPHPKANYSQAAVVDDYVFLAGQLASDFKTGVPAEAKVDPAFRFYGSDIELQTEFVVKNLAAVLEAAGSDLEHVIKAQTFLVDLDYFHGYDKVWKRHFSSPPPRTTIELDGDGLLVPGTLVEV
ncbi:MAG TPA: RidA family protein, partial [Solirubrobacterales bacterium]|nr:RidA family protein [Solirubrobacterales bacterium]